MSNSEALHYSLAEFSWILFFLALGASVLITVRLVETGEEAACLSRELSLLTEKNEQLTRDINILNELLAEKKNGVVPCWRRPEGVVPELMGTITIAGRDDLLIHRSRDDRSRRLVLKDSGRQDAIIGMLTELFSGELSYSRERNCYLRLRIINETNSFKFYEEAADAAAKAGIVVVQ